VLEANGVVGGGLEVKALSENNIALAGLQFSDKAWKLFMDNF